MSFKTEFGVSYQLYICRNSLLLTTSPGDLRTSCQRTTSEEFLKMSNFFEASFFLSSIVKPAVNFFPFCYSGYRFSAFLSTPFELQMAEMDFLG